MASSICFQDNAGRSRYRMVLFACGFTRGQLIFVRRIIRRIKGGANSRECSAKLETTGPKDLREIVYIFHSVNTGPQHEALAGCANFLAIL